MTLTPNESRVLAVLDEKDTVEPTDCARLASLGLGMTEAALQSLANKGLATANQVRKGLRKSPDGTWSISPDGRLFLMRD